MAYMHIWVGLKNSPTAIAEHSEAMLATTPLHRKAFDGRVDLTIARKLPRGRTLVYHFKSPLVGQSTYIVTSALLSIV